MSLRYHIRIMQNGVNVDSLFILSAGPIYTVTTVNAPKGLVTRVSATSPGQASPRRSRHNPRWEGQKTTGTRAPENQNERGRRTKNKNEGVSVVKNIKTNKKTTNTQQPEALPEKTVKNQITNTNVPLGLFSHFSISKTPKKLKFTILFSIMPVGHICTCTFVSPPAAS